MSIRQDSVNNTHYQGNQAHKMSPQMNWKAKKMNHINWFYWMNWRDYQDNWLSCRVL